MSQRAPCRPAGLALLLLLVAALAAPLADGLAFHRRADGHPAARRLADAALAVHGAGCLLGLSLPSTPAPAATPGPARVARQLSAAEPAAPASHAAAPRIAGGGTRAPPTLLA